MPTVEYYTDNIYADEYYLAQYVLSAVFIRKKYCYMLLTEDECNMLKERMPDLTINFLNSIPNSIYTIYELYAD